MRPPGAVPVIIDTDIGSDIDDAYAIALAIKGGLKIGGISTVSGDTIKRARMVKKMLVLSGNDQVPVFAGKPSRAMLTHGDWVNVSERFDVHENVEAMVEYFWHEIDRAGDYRLQIIAIGPLSNIALVRERDKATFDDRVQLLMMGGQFKTWLGGLRIHVPEYNVFMDKRAARAILQSRSPARIVPFDVTANLKLTRQHSDFLQSCSAHDVIMRSLAEMTRLFRASPLGRRSPILFDPATVAVLMDPTMFTFTSMPVEVTRGGFTRVPRGGRDGTPEKEVCTAIDAGRFYKLFLQTLTGKLPASRGPGEHGER